MVVHPFLMENEPTSPLTAQIQVVKHQDGLLVIIGVCWSKYRLTDAVFDC